MKKSRWTTEQIENLILLRSQGRTCVEAAMVLGMTKRAVDNQWRRLKKKGNAGVTQ